MTSVASLPGPSRSPKAHKRSTSASSTLSHRGPSRSRQPLESAKTVLSVELFKRRHAEEFAHLHPDADALTLAAEEEKLAEERRRGKAMRESIQLQKWHSGNGRDSPSWRPLSLLHGHEGEMGPQNSKRGLRGHARSKTSLNGIYLDTENMPPREAVAHQSVTRLRASSRSATPDNLVNNGQTLEVLIDKDDSLSLRTVPLSSKTSSPNSAASVNRSTYSWASSFSGETSELRTAAQYVPTEPDLTSDGTRTESDILNTPAKLDQRRKRIVAIAHTVRQLEGIGSRDLEDPTFYSVLAKAWYERFNQPQGQKSDPNNEALHVPTAAEISAELTSLGFSPGMDYGEDALASPPDPEFKTPQVGEFFGEPSHHAYPRPKSNAAQSQSSRSVRYSYASTLHDLAMEGGLSQGNQLMSEKAWLRPSSYVGTPWGMPLDGPPPLRAITPDQTYDDDASSDGHYMDSPFNLEPSRRLRRVEENITRPPIDSDIEELAVPEENEAQPGPSREGLGFLSSRSNTDDSNYSSPFAMDMDFQEGEDDIIPPTTPQQLSATPQSDTPSQVVLDPSTCNTTTTDHPISSAEIPVPVPLPIPVLGPREVVSGSFHDRNTNQGDVFMTSKNSHNHQKLYLSPPALQHQSSLSEEQDQSDISDYQSSNHFRPNFTRTPSNISSDQSETQPSLTRQDQLTTQLQRDNPQQSPMEEVMGPDGSIGLAISSPQSISQTRIPIQHQHQLNQDQDHYSSPILQQRQLTSSSENPESMIWASQYPLKIDMGMTPPKRTVSLSTTSLPSMTFPNLNTPPPSTLPRRTQKSSKILLGPVPQYQYPISASSYFPVSLTETTPPLGDNGIGHTAQINHQVSVLTRPPQRNASLRHPPMVETSHHLPAAPMVPVDQQSTTTPKRSGISDPKVLFWAGFLLPVLWFMGGWIVAKRQVHDSEKVDVQAESSGEAVGATQPSVPAWKAWASSDDVWVTRCKWATAISFPVLLFWGILAIILLGVLH